MRELTTLIRALDRAAEARVPLQFVDASEQVEETHWGRVRDRAVEVALGLRAEGVDPGDTVALVFPTGPDFLAACFGTLLAGAVPTPLYPPVRLGRLTEYQHRSTRMIRAAGASLVLADRRVAKILGEAVAPTDASLATLETLPAGNSRMPLRGGPAPSDLALVQFSSGTTVDPKPVALSHGAIMAHVQTLNRLWPPPPEGAHRAVSWLPLYHDMGLIGCVFGALDLGVELTLLRPETFVARPAVWLRAVSRFRASISAAPNFAYGLAAERIRDDEMTGVDLSSWTVALNGAESVSPRLMRRFIDRFEPWGFRPEALAPVYGLAEATLAVTFSSLEQPFVSRTFDRVALSAEGIAREDLDGRELASVGVPIPGVRIRIVADETGEELDEGRVGRVLVQGPSLMEGYLHQPDETRAAIHDGWLDTGDLGFLHEGQLYLVGRAKDVVILRGRNYSPEEFERAVDGLWGVRAGCSVAVSQHREEDDRERLVLFVEMRRDLDRGEREGLEDRCVAAVVSATGIPPDEVVVLEPGTLPRTSSGKLRRAETLARWEADELHPPTGVPAWTLAKAALRSWWALAVRRR